MSREGFRDEGGPSGRQCPVPEFLDPEIPFEDHTGDTLLSRLPTQCLDVGQGSQRESDGVGGTPLLLRLHDRPGTLGEGTGS